MPRRAAGSAASLRRRRGDLVGLDEADAERAVGQREEAEEGFAIAVAAADDLLLAMLPAVVADEVVELGLDGGGEEGERIRWIETLAPAPPCGGRPAPFRTPRGRSGRGRR